jgi:2-polyprenyl-3-methyl-5-hydroxy-6-metoxy-1,4-benzoquinol methylase
MALDYFFPDLRTRSELKEIMDSDSVDLKKLLKTVRQFAILNFLFTSSRRLIRENIFKVMKNAPEVEYTLLDLGAGGCDIDRWAIRKARRSGLKLCVTAIDRDERIMPQVRRSLENYPEIRIVQGSVFDLNVNDKYDFIFSNHFLHHLEWDEIEKIIRYAVTAAKIGFLFNDIRRTMSAFIFYTIFTALFLHGSLAYYDGRISIRRGFLKDELVKLLRKKSFYQQNNVKIEFSETFPSRINIKCFQNGTA